MAQQAVLKLTAENAELVRKLDQTTRKLKGLERQVESNKKGAKGAFDPLKKSVTNASGPLGSMSSKFSALSSAAGSASGPLAAAAVGVTGVVMAVGFMKDSIDVLKKLVGETKKLKRETGMSAEASSAWIGLASRFNVSAGSLSQTFGLLSVKIKKSLDPGTAGTKLQTLFHSLGVTTGQLKSGNMDSILTSVAESFKKMGPGSERTAAAVGLFGRKGKDLIPILGQGKDGIEALKKKMQQYGLVLNDGVIEDTTKLGKAQKDLKQMWEGVQIWVATKLVPTLSDWAGKIRDILEALDTGKSKDKFTQKVLEWKKIIEKGIHFGKLTGSLHLFTGNWTNIFGVFKNGFNMKWGKFFNSLANITNPLRPLITKMVNWFTGLRASGVKEAGKMVQKIKEKLSGGFSGIMDLVTLVPGKLASLAGRFANAGRQLGLSFINAIGTGLSGLGHFMSDAGNAIRDWMNQHTIFGHTIHIPTPLGSINIPIPALAQGGIVGGGTLALIGEDGPEAVIPLSGKHRARGASLYAQAGRAMGLNNGNTFNIYNTGSLDENALAARMAWQLQTRSGLA